MQAAYDAGKEVLESAAFKAEPANKALIQEIRKSEPAVAAAKQAWQNTRKANGSLVDCDRAANDAGGKVLAVLKKAEREKSVHVAFDAANTPTTTSPGTEDNSHSAEGPAPKP